MHTHVYRLLTNGSDSQSMSLTHHQACPAAHGVVTGRGRVTGFVAAGHVSPRTSSVGCSQC